MYKQVHHCTGLCMGVAERRNSQEVHAFSSVCSPPCNVLVLVLPRLYSDHVIL